MLLTALVVFIMDQSAKLLAASLLTRNETRPLIDGFLHFTLVHNTGTVFGLFPGANIVFVAASAVFLAFLLFVYYRMAPPSSPFRAAFGLIAGGAAGNLADRVRLGHVVDFIDLRFWPVFNVADIALTAGAVIIIWTMLLQKKTG